MDPRGTMHNTCVDSPLRRTWELDIDGAALGHAGGVLEACSETVEIPTRRSWALVVSPFIKDTGTSPAASQRVQDSFSLGKSGERLSGGEGFLPSLYTHQRDASD